MNNKGQTLVFFVVLIPLILALFAFVIDSAYIVRGNTKLYGIAYSALDDVVNQGKDINKVKRVIKENDNNIKIIVLDRNGIELTNEITPIFGKIIGYDKYNLDVKLYTSYENGKYMIKEKGK